MILETLGVVSISSVRVPRDLMEVEKLRSYQRSARTIRS